MAHKIVQLHDENGNDIYPIFPITGSLDLLWENSAPGSAMGIQTIAISNMDKYYWILIMYRVYTSQNRYAVMICRGAIGEVYGLTSQYGSYIRAVTIKSNGITLGTAAGSSTDNSAIIPYRIYGLDKRRD